MSENSDDRQVVKLVSSLNSVTSDIAENDVTFHRSIDSNIAERLDNVNSKLLNVINKFIRSITEDQVTTFNDEDDEDKILPEGKEALSDNWKKISEVFDSIYEKSDIEFDAMKQQEKKPVSNEKVSNSDEKMVYMGEGETSSFDSSRNVTKMQEKPQLFFRIAIDNSEMTSFKPKLTRKPHSMIDFEESMKLDVLEQPNHYKQPYAYEIDHQEYANSILEKSDPIKYKPWNVSDEPIWVDTVEKLAAMLEELKKWPELAVDLEHHDFRTYYGLVSLMQISTRSQDFLIDTLKLRDDLECLNEVFADPNVVKVFHGAFMDIIWLQRDLGLYVVSLFDTYHACKLLGFPKHSLAYLLERFANFKTDKKYQRADWRVRPLSNMMKLYARADTHFLLYIYDILKNSLIDKNLLKNLLHDSRNVAKRRFEYYKFRPSTPTTLVVTPITEKIEPWRNLMNKYNISLPKKQLVIDLYNWRDETARKFDESVRYIMPNQLLVALVISAPTESSGVMAASNFITESVRLNAKNIAKLIENSVKKSESEDLESMSEYYEENGHVLDNESAGADTKKEITERKVFLCISKYKKLVGGLPEQDTGLLKKKSNFFSKNMFLNSNNSVWAKGAEDQKSVTFGDIVDRFRDSYKTLSQDVDTIVEVEVPEINEAVNAKTVSEQEVLAKEKSLKEQKNEVIVIRKKTVRKPKKNAVVAAELLEPVVDYKNKEKILTGGSSNRSDSFKAPKKRKSFDPYGKEFEEPRAAKKQFLQSKGKHLSYKAGNGKK